jgi:hypothetical protein
MRRRPEIVRADPLPAHSDQRARSSRATNRPTSIPSIRS